MSYWSPEGLQYANYVKKNANVKTSTAFLLGSLPKAKKTTDGLGEKSQKIKLSNDSMSLKIAPIS